MRACPDGRKPPTTQRQPDGGGERNGGGRNRIDVELQVADGITLLVFCACATVAMCPQRIADGGPITTSSNKRYLRECRGLARKKCPKNCVIVPAKS